ncbi:MAG: hypothetical protein IT585_06070 [candidate division Zixibacteria bacterium]|nr:hypothetical protein [candidate division Zixibacteria bacterium]
MPKTPDWPTSLLVASQLIITCNLARPQSILDTKQFDNFVSFRTTVAQKAKTSGSFGMTSE